MIKFEDFFPVPYPDKTKVKFNMNAGNTDYPAWDYLIRGEEDPEWINMNAHKKKQANNNLNRAITYLLLPNIIRRVRIIISLAECTKSKRLFQRCLTPKGII